MSGAVAVLGPGAVGGLLAVRLAASGRRVVCVGRPAAVEALRREGLTLVSPSGTAQARPQAAERLEEPVDLLLVAVKAFALEEALERVAFPPRAVVPLLNGVDHLAVLRSRLGARVAAATIGRLEAYRESATRVVQVSAPAPLVTIARDHVPALAEEAAAILRRAGIEVRLAADGSAVLWEKLARLAPLAAMTAVTGKPLGEIRRDPRLRAGVTEACSVAAALGVPVSAGEQWRIIEALPASFTTSAARDVASGRPSELAAIVGPVVRAGRRLGVETPILEELLARCPA